MKQVMNYLVKWNKRSDAFTKLQSVYLALTVAIFTLAAIMSLISPRVGQTILFFAAVSGLVFVANGVLWAVIRTFVSPAIEAKAPSARRK